MSNNGRALPAYFPENASPVSPLRGEGGLPTPLSLGSLIPLPERPEGLRPKVLIVDDEASVLDGLERSWRQYYVQCLDLRFWRAGNSPGLIEQICQWLKGGWRPDVVVIDINMDDGGNNGVDYLDRLRKTPGCLAIPIVLATGNQYRDLDKNQLSEGKNLTGLDPSQWSVLAHAQEPEAILYGKTADAIFLGRIGEHLPEWRIAAQRRTWIALLNRIAPFLDGASIKVETVAEQVVGFAITELQIDDAFIRWKEEASGHEGRYWLVAKKSTRPGDCHYADRHAEIGLEDVPILQCILKNVHDPVIEESLTEEQSGIFKSAIAGNRFLGVGLYLGNQAVGFITLLRDAKNKPFSLETDGRYLNVLARLLASALGRDRLMRVRQTGLLDFAGKVAVALDKKAVCLELSKFLHTELHDGSDDVGKVTVRLLDFGSGMLCRWAHAGMRAGNEDIFIADTAIVYAECVRENVVRRYDDMCNDELKSKYKNFCIDTRSELCVPLSIGEHPIGGVNLEHKKNCFYHKHDEHFVRAAAGLAASAIERISDGELLNGMADFAHDFWRVETGHLEKRLKSLLYDFCAYSVLVRLRRNVSDVWEVEDVECRIQKVDADRIKDLIGQDLSKSFDQTWFGKKWQEGHWKREWAAYTDNDEDFMPMMLAKDMKQRADALLWLRRDESPPHQALMLMWGLPPPISEAGIALLGNLARLFSQLASRRLNIEEMTRQHLEQEQAAAIGHVMQHFRHRLGNLTGSQHTHIELVEMAYSDHDESAFLAAMGRLKANARDIANAYSKSKGYIKKIELVDLTVNDIVEQACLAPELQCRLTAVSFNQQLDANMKIITDVEIASLVLYSLLENALDALHGKVSAQVELRSEQRGSIGILAVADNGPGVSMSIRKKLFSWGETTKIGGLGSALAFARTRMRLMGGDLIFPERQPEVGALFEMHFPIAGGGR